MGSKKLTIGIYLNTYLEQGGGFQYEYRIATLLKCITDYKLFYFTTNEKTKNSFSEKNFKIKLLNKDKLENKLIEIYKLDLVYTLSPVKIDLANLPYIVTVWDLCHRDFNEFPEVRHNLEFEKREKLYNSDYLRKAVAIITDSKLGKKNIIKRYGIDKVRIKVLKFLTRKTTEIEFIDIKNKYNFNHPYIYYPAQFWAHKNHIYILKALKILKESYGLEIYALFSGADYGNLNYILEQSKKFNIQEQIKYLGFVDDKKVPNLYKQSIALVMPTYFGPTNLPPLEAFNYKVPVCYSDLPGLKEQVGEAAFLLNLNNPNDLAQKLITIMDNHKLVKEKIDLGLKILNEWTEEDFLNELLKIFNSFKTIRECWGEIKPPKIALGLNNIDFNLLVKIAYNLNKDNCKYIVYGNGSISKALQLLIPKKITGFVDIADKDNHPVNLKTMEYDYILISVLGREEEIIDYLTNELEINRDKIITLDI